MSKFDVFTKKKRRATSYSKVGASGYKNIVDSVLREQKRAKRF